MPSFHFPWVGADGRTRSKLIAFDDDGEYLPDVPKMERYACKGCDPTAEVVRWCGARWLGTPMPLRHWRRWMCTDVPRDWVGCGCLLRLKIAAGEMAKVRVACASAFRATLPEVPIALGRARRIMRSWRSRDARSTPAP